MVLIAFDGAPHPIRHRREEAFVGCRRAFPPLQLEAVGFEIALVHDPQAVLVAQVQESGIGWVVTRAYGVHVVGEHQLNVGAHRGLVQRAAGQRMPLVAVHPSQHQWRPVDENPVADDLHRAKPDPDVDLLTWGRQRGRIEPRGLLAPRFNVNIGKRFVGVDVEDSQLGHAELSGLRGLDLQPT